MFRIYLIFEKSKMIKNALLWLFLGCGFVTQAQNITVIDGEQNMPLDQVTLVSPDHKIFAVTNLNGEVDISMFKEVEKIEIRINGYETLVKSYADLKEANFMVRMNQSNFSLNEVVVSASRWRQSADNVPSKIITISAADVILQNPQTAADLLAASGEVFVQKSQQGGGSPMIRGFATNRLLYAVDGVRMNTAIFRGGNIQNVISLDPFAIENTEVMFGPGSVIYGSDAIGGVMSFQTLTPDLSTTDKPLISGKAVSRYSSANKEKTGHFDVNIGWEKWAMVTSFTSTNFDHLRQGNNGPDDYIKDYYVQRQDSADVVITQDDPLLQIPTAYSQINLMQKIRFKPNKKWDFQYGFHYSETSSYGRYDRHNRVKKGRARYAEWNYGPQKWMMNNLNITNQANNKVYDQMSIRLAHQLFGESRIDRSLNKTERTTNTEEVQAYSVNLDFLKKISKKNTLFYGAEYILNDVTSIGVLKDISTGIETQGPSRYPNSKWSSFGVYVNDEYAISEKWNLQAGLRYNQYALEADFSQNKTFYPFPFTTSKTSNGSLTGSLGAVYRPAKSVVISTNFGTAFRAPNVDDIGKVFDSEPGSVIVPNPDLKAEYAYNVDLGITKVFNDALKVNVTGYYTILENAMVRRNAQLNGQDSILYSGDLSQVQTLQNAAKANVYGLQAGFELKFMHGFSFSSDFNYQVGKEELADGSVSASRHAAPVFGATRLSYKRARLNWQFYVNYQGERKFKDLAVDEQSKDEIYAKDVNGNNYSPAWCTLNIKAMYDLSKTFSFSTGLENITNQRYRSYSSGISAPGRNFILSLKAKF